MKTRYVRIHFADGNTTDVSVDSEGLNDQLRIAQKPLTELREGDLVEFVPSYAPEDHFKAEVASIELFDEMPPDSIPAKMMKKE